MNLDNILKREKELIIPEKKEMDLLKSESKKLVSSLREIIFKKKINIDVFVGGSLAKGSLLKKEKYDVDIFLRFEWKLENISAIAFEILKELDKSYKISIIHGSRDYFKLEKNKIVFEIVPVYKIKHPREARNVTDLSYFHVNYVKRKTNEKLREEILLAKQFCHAQGIYGAESYVQGFSGYGLECLIIYYKKFSKMLKELSKVEDRIIIDIEKYYKKKSDVLFMLNESKLKGPIILVDPTFKERNVLAALSRESFEKFKRIAFEFLKSPSLKFFESKKFNANELSRKGEILKIKIKTDRQEGDIAGTKMKKFFRFLGLELSKYMDIFESKFLYEEGQSADCYFVVKPKKEFVVIGPPIKMKDSVIAFKKKHKDTYEKAGYVHAKEKIEQNPRKLVEKLANKEKERLRSMGITWFSVV